MRCNEAIHKDVAAVMADRGKSIAITVREIGGTLPCQRVTILYQSAIFVCLETPA